MNRNLLFFIFFLVGLVVLIGVYKNVALNSESDSYHKKNLHHQFVVVQANKMIGFDLVDPEQAPSDIKKSVMRGYNILMDTPRYASQYVRDQLSCTSCHFSEGDTLGGRNNGISLVGVTTVFPSYSKRAGKVISLADRINSCFERSMNGWPLPVDSQEMQDILAYLKWISKEVEQISSIPWLGLSLLKSHHIPNINDGMNVYKIYCALCHKADGQGGGKLMPSMQKQIPPLWGENSFNDGAGMNDLSKLAAFIYWNMPQNNSILTEEQALDVAGFILDQPRQHF